MRNTAIKLISLIVLTISFSVVSANAQMSARYTGTIPFDFKVGNVMFKSGDYSIRLLDPKSHTGMYVITTTDGRVAKVFLSSPRRSDERGAAGRLIFVRSDSGYLLSAISTAALNATFRLPHAQRTDKEQLATQSVSVRID